MKKIQQHIINFHQKSPWYVVVAGMVFLIFVILFIFNKVRGLLVDVPVLEQHIHTNVIYYNGVYLQDFKAEIPDTASFVINQSPETIYARIYETKNATSSFETVTIPSGAERFIQPQSSYLAQFVNASNTSTSTLLVGQNTLINKERFEILKTVVLEKLNPGTMKSIRDAYGAFYKIHQNDTNFSENCQTIGKELAGKMVAVFGKDVAGKNVPKYCKDAYVQTVASSSVKQVKVK